MTATATQLRNHPTPPLKLFQRTFCDHCTNQCAMDEPRRLHCEICLIADELARLRQTIQRQHPNW